MTATLAPSGAADSVPPLVPLRRNRRFQLLWIGGVCSTLGLETAAVAYPLLILAVTGSAAQAGLFGLVMMLTITVGALPAGEIADRFDQRRVLLLADGCRLGAVASVAAAVALGTVSLGHLAAAAAVFGAAQVFGGTARLLVLRRVVPPAQLSAALTREEVRSGATQMAGPALGGFLYGVAAALPFAVNALCVAVSWLCAFAVRVRPAGVAGPPERGAPLRRVFAGVTVLWHARALRGTVLLMLALNIATAPVPLIAIVVLSRQGTPSAGIGLAVAGLAVGALAGIALIRPLLQRFRPGILLLAVGAAEVAILWGLAVPLGPYWVATVLFVSMLPIPALRVAMDLLIFRRALPGKQGRTIAAVNLALGVGFAGGIGIAGLALEWLGVVGTQLVLLGVLGAAVVYLACDPHLRTMPWPADPAPPRTDP